MSRATTPAASAVYPSRRRPAQRVSAGMTESAMSVKGIAESHAAAARSSGKPCRTTPATTSGPSVAVRPAFQARNSSRTAKKNASQ